MLYYNHKEEINQNEQHEKENTKMKTSQVKAYYQDYMRAVNYYGHRKILDCYKNPSCAKMGAERDIGKECASRDGYGYSVISYNTCIFTCGYVFHRDGEPWFAVHTPRDYGEMKIEED